MPSDVEERIAAVARLVAKRASSSTLGQVTPSRSRLQKERLITAVSANYVALDELNHVFSDINSTSALDYFNADDADLIRQAASSLSSARRALRRLAKREWVRKSPNNQNK